MSFSFPRRSWFPCDRFGPGFRSKRDGVLFPVRESESQPVQQAPIGQSRREQLLAECRIADEVFQESHTDTLLLRRARPAVVGGRHLDPGEARVGEPT